VDVDSDHDGLPDWWEILHGTNPNSPPGDFSDSNADPNGDGYSNLEDYLNWLAAPHVTCAQDSSVNLDLGQFTAGFTNLPVYSVFSPTLGTVAILGDGKTAQFTPTPGTNGLGSFSFSVTDAVGSTLTNSVGIHVTPTVTPPLTAFQQWQILYFGTTNNPNGDPNADPDGDGQNNLAEFLSGTNPTNTASVFRIISAAQQSNDVVITWATAGGFTNAVQATVGDGNGGYATNYTDISGPVVIFGTGDATTNYVDVGGLTNNPSRYYRVRLVP
jgi:Bacterial TSP3 repeat